MKRIAIFFLYAALLLVAAAMLFPLFWMLLLSVKEQPQSAFTLAELIVSPYTTQHYREMLSSDTFGVYLANSFFVAGAVTLGNVVLCLFCGYAFARKEFRGKQLFFLSVLGVMMIPPHVVMIPLYRMMVQFGWINSYLALILPWLVTPFGIFLVRQYVQGIPADVEDAARIDGASEWYIVWRVVMPLCKPVLVVLALYTFLSQWNAFLFPFLFTNDLEHRTLTVALAFFHGKQTVEWANLMASASIAAVPIIALFLVFQRQIIQAMTIGALKE
ncbi:MAG: carbohydrate ABC transporter permease [Candidatus Kapaibacterium sp.]|nr:MAG: carbohydrate ABC transporter permease [Candidatus Kapabacteria bacterium]